ncbi:MAG: hypothetical protein HY366_01085 [Candidatus Aenigmarchaeota archaeon]|nr:hypothetical protein [Candidatus Aenigmarchaeota archaeon]
MIRKLFKLKGATREDTVENVSFLVLFVAAAFVAVGISVGTFVPGFPVALAVTGALLVVISLLVYITSEFLRIFAQSPGHEHKQEHA